MQRNVYLVNTHAWKKKYHSFMLFCLTKSLFSSDTWYNSVSQNIWIFWKCHCSINTICGDTFCAQGQKVQSDEFVLWGQAQIECSTLDTAHYTLHTVHCTLCTAHCISQYTLHTVNCTLHTVTALCLAVTKTAQFTPSRVKSTKT